MPTDGQTSDDEWSVEPIRDLALDGEVEAVDRLCCLAAAGLSLAGEMADHLDQDQALSGADFIEEMQLALEGYRRVSGGLPSVRTFPAVEAAPAEAFTEDHFWTVADWQADVANGDTRRSYEEWLAIQKEIDRDTHHT